MAKIPLRTYLKEIEGYIERGEVDQAIAHARNIIQYYPKQIDAYRLLGKAYLESQHFSEASDILQRVLAVIPDDFVAQIGMSIIREDEGNLDSAIWHMERAYEVQPFNPAVQDELRRLYGRRDGIEPPKIRLTRGALVRMYLRGELYNQAIAETRAALADDPERHDLMVLLARLYLLSNNKLEATEISSTLISKLPYCLEANQTLCKILPGTSRAEDLKKFQQRIIAIDPYSAFISPTTPSSDLVPEQAVLVEQFAWSPSEIEPQTPDWTRNIGIQWDEAVEVEPPDWLQSLTESNSIPQPSEEIIPDNQEKKGKEISAKDQPELRTQDEVVPDFMREAGWKTSDQKQEPTAAFSEDDKEIEPAIIPDWLQSIAPEQMSEEGDNNVETVEWVEGLRSEPPKSDNQPFSEPVIGEPQSQDNPTASGWYEESPINRGPVVDDEQQITLDTLPDWMTGEADTTSEVVPAELIDEISKEEDQILESEVQIPDWLTELESEVEVEPSLELLSSEWSNLPGEEINQIAPTEEFIPVPAESEMKPGESLEEYTRNIFPSDGELTQQKEISSEQVPDWMIEFEVEQDLSKDETQAVSSGAGDTILDIPIETTKTPEIPLSEGISSEATPDLDDLDAAMAWLEGLAARQGADEETLTIPPEKRLETPPEWVKELPDDLPQEEEAIETSDEPILQEGVAEPFVEAIIIEETVEPPVTSLQIEETTELIDDFLSTEDEFETLTKPPEIAETKDLSGELFQTEETAESLGESFPVEETLSTESKELAGEIEQQMPIQAADSVKVEDLSFPEWLDVVDEEAVEQNPGPWIVEEPLEAGLEEQESIETNDNSQWVGKEMVVEDETIITSPSEPEPNWLANLSEENEETDSSDFRETTTLEPITTAEKIIGEIPKQQQTEPVEFIQDKAQPFIALQENLLRGNIEFALAGLNELIEKGESLPETIEMIREALYRFPVDISLWQTLGDAYARNNQLQEALDSYTKAEELLR